MRKEVYGIQFNCCGSEWICSHIYESKEDAEREARLEERPNLKCTVVTFTFQPKKQG